MPSQLLFYRFYKTPTPSAGSWSAKVSSDFDAAYKMQPRILRQILVRSASASTTFNAVLVDDNGVQIRRFLGATEISNDLTPTPILGDIEIQITGASVDEQFQVLMIFSNK